jgi:UDP-glucose 4-epimerase
MQLYYLSCLNAEEITIKCLVTGGAGFIGSHLTELLLGFGHNVVVVDNLSVGKMQNLQPYRDSSKFVFHELDISNYDSLSKIFIDVDFVFHLAGLADIVPSIENPDKYFNANVIGTFNIAKLSFENNVKKVIYAASSSCYGIQDFFPTPETAICNPKYPYALTKYLGEQILMHWNLVYKLPVISLRLFNVYGLRARTSGTYGAVFGVFLAQKLAGKPFTVVGDGTQTRDFTFVSDVCRAFLTAAHSSLSGEIFNVGSGHTYEVNKLVSVLGGPVVNIPKRPAEPDCTFADIAKIIELLGWKPEVSLEEGVAVMLEHIQDWNEAPLWDINKIEGATKSWFKYLGGNN